ncbi:DUF4252 domain-containing protein [Aquimarina longa]|uniref:DUF4252 domain-containing protein n=1 Tax=Aquimarina longa TaxID=1080221 RepID=UPI00078084B2|nr:DUF4252 domain-containing protein [Aquimarina longa]
MKNVIIIIGIIGLSLITSCTKEPSLQKYFVDHQNDAEFIAVDIPSSLLSKETIKLTEEEQEALESIKKINFLALPLNGDNQSRFEKEQAAIKKIIASDDYESLMRFNFHGIKAILKYQGEDDDIDEAIIFATHQEKGLALLRILGDNMKPEKIAVLMQSIEKGKINIEALKKLENTIELN